VIVGALDLRDDLREPFECRAALPLLTHPSAGAPEALVESNQSRAIRCGAGAELVVWLFLFDASSPRFSRHRP